MKTNFFLLALMIFPLVAMGQIKQKNLSEVKVTPPVFTGIQKVFNAPENISADPLGAYLTENFKYPDAAADCLIEGTGIVQFTVQPNGELTNFEVINSVCGLIDREFIRILKTTEGMWNPGYNNNKPVAMEKEVSMMFVASQAHQNDPGEYFMRNAKMLNIKGNKLFLVKFKPKKALNYYEKSIKFMPYETSSLIMRGLCRFELGDEKGACSDWNRINAIGRYDADEFITNFCEFKGYETLTQVLNTKDE